jgi:hypothetical protein
MISNQQNNSNASQLAPSSSSQMTYVGPTQVAIKNQATLAMPKPTHTTLIQGSYVLSPWHNPHKDKLVSIANRFDILTQEEPILFMEVVSSTFKVPSSLILPRAPIFLDSQTNPSLVASEDLLSNQ